MGENINWMGNNKKKKSLQISIDEDLLKEFKLKTLENDTTMGKEVILFIENYLKKEKISKKS